MVYVFLAEGFEEIEALTPVDLLRRAEIEVKTVGIGGRAVLGAHAIQVMADLEESQVDQGHVDAIILPGGALGTANLAKSALVSEMIDRCVNEGKLIAAICAAPSILGQRGLLHNKRATAFPSFRDQLSGAILDKDPVVRDGNLITAAGMGVSIDFSAEIISALKNREIANEIKSQIQCIR